MNPGEQWKAYRAYRDHELGKWEPGEAMPEDRVREEQRLERAFNAGVEAAERAFSGRAEEMVRRMQ